MDDDYTEGFENDGPRKDGHDELTEDDYTMSESEGEGEEADDDTDYELENSEEDAMKDQNADNISALTKPKGLMETQVASPPPDDEEGDDYDQDFDEATSAKPKSLDKSKATSNTVLSKEPQDSDDYSEEDEQGEVDDPVKPKSVTGSKSSSQRGSKDESQDGYGEDFDAATPKKAANDDEGSVTSKVSNKSKDSQNSLSVALVREERDKRWAIEKLYQEAQDQIAELKNQGKTLEIRALKAEKDLRKVKDEGANTKELQDKIKSLEGSLNRAEEDLKAKEQELEKSKIAARPSSPGANSMMSSMSLTSKPQSPKRLDRNLKKEELEEELFRASQRLVQEGERNSQLAIKNSKITEELGKLKSDTEDLRTSLIEGLAGGGIKVNQNNYKHISLVELMRLRLQQEASQASAGDNLSKSSLRSTKSRRQMNRSATQAGLGDDENIKEMEGVRAVELENKNLQAKVKRLSERCDILSGELAMAVGANDDVAVLKAKATQLVDRQKQEKEGRLKSERNLQLANNKIGALSDHIEKLMFHLKHEAAAKAKAYGAQRRVQKELELMKARNAALVKKNNSRERVITELKEGSKILEDQLRLMDEKYMELRTKLDWQRTKSQKEVNKYKTEAKDLRMKWAYVNPDGTLLDEVEVDPAYPGGLANTTGKIRIKKGSNKKRPKSNMSDRDKESFSPAPRPYSTSPFGEY